jgi:hypothetical protein
MRRPYRLALTIYTVHMSSVDDRSALLSRDIDPGGREDADQPITDDVPRGRVGRLS